MGGIGVKVLHAAERHLVVEGHVSHLDEAGVRLPSENPSQAPY